MVSIVKLAKNIKAAFNNFFTLIIGTATGTIHWNYYVSKKNHCQIDLKSKIHPVHDLWSVSVGFGTSIGPNSRISFTEIGKFCSIGPNLICGWGIHPTNGVSTSPVFYSTLKQVGFTYSNENKISERKPITIGNDVFIGANVTILDGVEIANGAIIGAGAVVSKNIPPYAIAVGCPIKVIKYRFTPDVIEKLQQIKWWDKDEDSMKEIPKYFFDVETYISKHH